MACETAWDKSDTRTKADIRTNVRGQNVSADPDRHGHPPLGGVQVSGRPMLRRNQLMNGWSGHGRKCPGCPMPSHGSLPGLGRMRGARSASHQSPRQKYI